ncbi:hypothetical protein B296_00051240 [Ensete ventricosum]|uniref:RRM domain-containing protein n=1 Tax=Ensete ventricosum TaxID=4639 RepID=A0A426YHJ6_ENSVE|nr:hypothetical protein B296_00051240 [Ensete ventricosum]
MHYVYRHGIGTILVPTKCWYAGTDWDSDRRDFTDPSLPTEQRGKSSQGALLFGKRLELNFSKYPNVTPAADTHEYAGSGLNRFSNNAVKNYKYCCSPTKMIHLSSLPQDVTEEDIVTHLEEHGMILNVKLFEVNGKKQALVLFEDEEQATEALVCKHANAIDRSVIRISFSQLQSI